MSTIDNWPLGQNGQVAQGEHYHFNQKFIDAYQAVKRRLSCTPLPNDVTGEIRFRFSNEITRPELETLLQLCYTQELKRSYTIVPGNLATNIDFVVHRAKG